MRAAAGWGGGEEEEAGMRALWLVVVLVCVWGGRRGVYTNSGNSLHKPVHSKDAPFNLH